MLVLPVNERVLIIDWLFGSIHHPKSTWQDGKEGTRISDRQLGFY